MPYVRGIALLLVSAGVPWAADSVFERILAPASSSSIRKTEAAIVELKDGRLLLAYTDFYTVFPRDDAPARILGRHSSDQGRTWSRPFVMVENTAKQNVMSVSLLRLASGELAMTYMFKNSHERLGEPDPQGPDCSVLFRISRDEGKTFSSPVTITPQRSFWVMNNDRLVQLKSGRLLAPCQRLDNWPMVRHSLTQVLYSDDHGKTWSGSQLVDIRTNPDGADEPGVVELKDGRVLMYFRTDLGRIYQAFSSDQGVTWTTPEPMTLAAPVSPAIIKRIPSTGDLLIVWNHTLPHRRGGHTDRFPLSAAVSRDEGRTWQIRDLDTDVRFTFGYPSLTFVKDRVLVTYWAAKDWPWWVSLKLKALPASWFYEQGD
ncbi:MAG: sialidase family protein [Bryobacteraceae bacterium]